MALIAPGINPLFCILKHAEEWARSGATGPGEGRRELPPIALLYSGETIHTDGPNHLGSRYNALPDHQMAVITSGSSPDAAALHPPGRD